MRTESQLQNKLIRSLSRILGSETVDFWLTQSGSIQTPGRTLAKIVKVERETADSVSLVLQPNSNFPGFEAGQHVNAIFDVNGIRHTRSYSFSDAPSKEGCIRLTIKQTEGGAVSTYVNNNVQVGEVVELGDVFGEMTLNTILSDVSSDKGSVLLIAAGSGITPMMSLVEEFELRGWPANVTLMYYARQADQLIFNTRFEEIATRTDAFQYLPILEDSNPADVAELSGRPAAGHFKSLGKLDQSVVCVCGPDGFMKAIKGLVEDKAQAWHAESFTPAALVVDENAPVKTYSVTLTRSNRVVEVNSNQPLLKALQEKGVNPPYGCGMGICNTCSCEKLVGNTQNMQNKSVCADSKTALRLCINSAQSDLTLDL